MEKVSSEEDDAHYVEFYRKAVRLLRHKVLGRTGGLVDKIHVSCCAAGTRQFVVHRAC